MPDTIQNLPARRQPPVAEALARIEIAILHEANTLFGAERTLMFQMLTERLEIVTWRNPLDLPDDELNVLVYAPDYDDAVFLGYHCDGQWWDAHNPDDPVCPVTYPVRGWREIPASPYQAEKEAARG